MKRFLLIAFLMVGIVQASIIKQDDTVNEKIEQFQNMKADKIVETILASLNKDKYPIKIDFVTSLVSIETGKTPDTLKYTYSIDKEAMKDKFIEIMGQEKYDKFDWKAFDKNFSDKIAYVNTSKLCSDNLFKTMIDKGVKFEYKYSYDLSTPFIDLIVEKKDCDKLLNQLTKMKALKELPTPSKDNNSSN